MIHEVHHNVLRAIQEEGGRLGIAYYKKYVHVYESLPLAEAASYWRELIDILAEKEKLDLPSILAKDDPYSIDLENKSLDENLKIMIYRQTFWQGEKLDAALVRYIINTYEQILSLEDNIAEIPFSEPQEFQE